jgi:hypothetical protein
MKFTYTTYDTQANEQVYNLTKLQYQLKTKTDLVDIFHTKEQMLVLKSLTDYQATSLITNSNERLNFKNKLDQL